ncbi:MAG: hypothetical protein AAB961_00695, partial [Patescibacteria group bacterium]
RAQKMSLSGGAEGGRAGAKRSEIFFEIGSNFAETEYYPSLKLRLAGIQKMFLFAISFWNTHPFLS